MNAALLLPLALVLAHVEDFPSLDPTTYGVVYDVPATAEVEVLEGLVFRSGPGPALELDLYRPRTRGAPVPVVVFANGVGDRPGARVKDWAQYRTWPRLAAAHGLAGVAMDCDGEAVQESLAAVFVFLEREGPRLGLDGRRVGVFACSANVGETSRLLFGNAAPAGVRSAVFYYGVPEVAAARRDLSVLLVTAESDLARLRPALDGLWSQTLSAGAPWTFELASGLPHAFDCLADEDASRRIVQRTLAFWKSTLEPLPGARAAPSPERAILAAQYGNDEARQLQLLDAWIERHPGAAQGYAQRGLVRARLGRGPAARADLARALELGEDAPVVHGTLGRLLAYENRPAEAVVHLRRALEGGWTSSELLGELGHAQLLLGENEAAVASYEEALRVGIPPGAATLGLASYNLACGYARLGRVELALAAVERAVEQGFGTRRAYEQDADLAALRDEERFLAALERLAR